MPNPRIVWKLILTFIGIAVAYNLCLAFVYRNFRTSLSASRPKASGNEPKPHWFYAHSNSLADNITYLARTANSGKAGLFHMLLFFPENQVLFRDMMIYPYPASSSDPLVSQYDPITQQSHEKHYRPDLQGSHTLFYQPIVPITRFRICEQAMEEIANQLGLQYHWLPPNFVAPADLTRFSLHLMQGWSIPPHVHKALQNQVLSQMSLEQKRTILVGMVPNLLHYFIYEKYLKRLLVVQHNSLDMAQREWFRSNDALPHYLGVSHWHINKRGIAIAVDLIFKETAALKAHHMFAIIKTWLQHFETLYGGFNNLPADAATALNRVLLYMQENSRTNALYQQAIQPFYHHVSVISGPDKLTASSSVSPVP